MLLLQRLARNWKYLNLKFHNSNLYSMAHSEEFLKLVEDSKKQINEVSVAETQDKLKQGAHLIDVREEGGVRSEALKLEREPAPAPREVSEQQVDGGCALLGIDR